MVEERNQLIFWFRNIQNKYPKLEINVNINTASIEELKYNKEYIIYQIDEYHKQQLMKRLLMLYNLTNEQINKHLQEQSVNKG